ncbi:MAG: calcium/sodium antiporter [Candidatus Neomarinimicrobiota bacterium]
MIVSTVGLIIIGLILVLMGAEALVRGSSSLALRLGVSPLLIGLTIVAYGTSFPELIVSTKAALLGEGDISMGNILGSNIFNIAFILGLSAIVRPMKVKSQLVRMDTPVMIVVAGLLYFFFRDFLLTRIEGLLLFLGALIYTGVIIGLAHRERMTANPAENHLDEGLPHTLKNIWLDLGFIAVGFGLLFAGANILVDNSVVLAQILGVSQAVIGLTIVAVGTSVPELATSIVAARRNQADIAIANVVGSNIFNILGILGISSLIHPIQGIDIKMLDLFWMIGTSVVLLPFLLSGFRLNRAEGLFLVLSYGVYMFILWPK